MPDSDAQQQLAERVSRAEAVIDGHEKRLDFAEQAQLRLQHDIESTRNLMEKLESRFSDKIDERWKATDEKLERRFSQVDSKIDTMRDLFAKALSDARRLVSPWFALGLTAFGILATIFVMLKLQGH